MQIERSQKMKYTGVIFRSASIIVILALCYLVYLGSRSDSQRIRYSSVKNLPYMNEVTAAEKDFGVDRARIYAIIQVESDFNQNAESKSGALGLMQMLPSTFEEQCAMRGEVFSVDKLTDPAVNISYCTEYLAQLYAMIGSYDWAHIAYYAGIGNVNKWRAEGLTPENIPNDSARIYLERIRAAYNAYKKIIYTEKEG